MRNETGIEKKVRDELTKRRISFIQEFPVRIGKRRWCYYIDFYIPKYNLVIEVDGVWWHRTVSQKKRDARKDKRLTNLGFIVRRIPELDVHRDVSKAIGDILIKFTK